LHVTGDLVHLKVKNIKTIEELSKLNEKPLAKERNEVMMKKKECGTRNQFCGSYSIGLCWMCVIRLTTCTSRRMCVKLLVEHCYNRSPKEKIIKMQGRILKSWALGQSSMQRKRRWGRTFPLLQPPCQG
jgi:hypothetical protein